MVRLAGVVAMLVVLSACSSAEPEVISEPDPTSPTTTVAPTSAAGGDDAPTTTAATTTTAQAGDGLPEGVVESGTAVPPGSTVRVTGFESEILDVTLAEVVDPATPGLFSEPSEGRRLVGFRLVIANQSDGVWSDSPFNSVTVIADDNTQHTASFASIEEGPDFANATAGPGDVRQGWVAVELPATAAIHRTRYTPSSGFAEDFAEWDMTLGAVPPGAEPVVTTPQAAVGDTITLRNLDDTPVAISVDAVVDPAEPGEFSGPQDGSRLVAIQLTLTNEGTVNYQDSVENIASVVTSEGFGFSTTFADTAAGPGFDGSVVLTPGDVRTGWIVFEIPLEFTIAKMTAALDSGFGPEVGEWGLTQSG